MHYTSATFRPRPWLANRHVQTILPSTGLLSVPQVDYQREALDLPDGDFVDIDWAGRRADAAQTQLIVLHGLEGSSDSNYARTMAATAVAAGWAVAVLHFRGCSGRPNRLPRRYHAGDTGDIAFLASQIRARHPAATLLATGYSLGGNVLLKYLAENGNEAAIDAGVAVCVPYDLHDSARALSSGAARFYQRFLLRRMRQSMQAKYRPELAPFDWARAMAATTFFEFDDLVTAPLHGFRGVDDYYNHSSCGQYLPAIVKPTLLISALDDPFMTPAAFPEPGRLPKAISHEFTAHGGHVGFVSGASIREPEYWLHARTMGYFAGELGIETTAEVSSDELTVAIR